MSLPSNRFNRRAVAALTIAMLALGLTATRAASGEASRSVARLPLCFEAAHDLAESRFEFLARGRGHTYFLAPAEAVIVVGKVSASLADGPRYPGQELVACGSLETKSLRFQLLGSDPGARMSGVALLPGKVNYLLGNDPSHWRSGIATFGKVRVQAAYPGIDLVYYASDQQLEYDFFVAPGGHPELIRLQVAGADSLRLDREGNLLVQAGAEQLRQQRPVAYQIDGNVRKEVSVAYRLEGARTFSFALGHFNRALPLVIDPVLSYATYLGGEQEDKGRAVALDSSGNVYVAGISLSTQLATTPGASQPNYAGGTTGGGDAFVAKLDASGSNLIYLTYLGGQANDAAYSIAVDGAGSAYVTGLTDSTNFPVAAALQPNLRGTPLGFFLTLFPAEAFVTKLNPAGSALIYSTYLGGDTTELGYDIAVDAGGNAYVTGYTDSTNFPTANALQPVRGGGQYDAFVTKIASNGSAFVYSTYLGGTNLDQGLGIRANAAGEAFVTGLTQSTNFPTTNAFQPWLAGGQDAFLTVFGANGTNLVRSTYLGGEADDVAFRVAMDSAGNAYLAGFKQGYLFPVTPGNLNPGGVFQSSNAGAIWNASSSGLANPNVNSLAYDPVAPARVYAGTGRGIARSSDGGATWDFVIKAAATAAGLAPGIALTSVASIVVDPLTPATVYAAAADGVYKSLDAGTNWSLMSTGLAYPPITALAINPANPATLYAGTGGGVFKSTNGAATWTYVFNIYPYATTALAIDPATPATVYAGSALGIHRSTDAGTNWITFNSGLTNEFRDTLLIDPLTPATLYAGTWGGLFKTTDRGTNWTMLNLGSPYNTNITAIAINPQSPSTLYAAYASHINRAGILKSVDGGSSWPSLSNIAENGVASLAVDPQAPGNVLAGLYGTTWFGAKDVFVAKLGTNLEYSTIFGGAADDQASSVAVDPVGNAYVTGMTLSTNFPVSSGLFLQTTNQGGKDAFVVSLDASGNELLYSTYLGGAGNDYGYGIDVDVLGNAWVVGQTLSLNLSTPGALQPAFAGGAGDAFIARLAQQPWLRVAVSGGNAVLSWRAYAPDFKLQSSPNVAVAAGWTLVPQTPVLANGWHTVTLGATNTALFFRLSR